VKSFVFRADKPLDAGKLEDFLGAIVQVYGPSCCATRASST
jgi:hypothetical protein